MEMLNNALGNTLKYSNITHIEIENIGGKLFEALISSQAERIMNV